MGGNSSAHGSVTPPPQPLNFGSAGSGDMGLPYMTTESLLRKIQALLKAAADKIRDDDRALNFEKGEWAIWWPLGIEHSVSVTSSSIQLAGPIFLASLSFRPKRFNSDNNRGGGKNVLRTICPPFVRIPQRLPSVVIPPGERVIFCCEPFDWEPVHFYGRFGRSAFYRRTVSRRLRGQ